MLLFCCSMELFHREITQLEKNGCDNKFNRCLWTILNKIYSKNFPQHTVSKKDIYIFLPCLGKLSLSARSTLEKTILGILSCVNLKLVFRIKNRLSSKFTFKDKISKEMRSLLCYKFQCSSCNATYYGKTKRHFKVRVSEHMGISARTDKNIMSTKNSAVRDQILVCNNILSFKDFSVLDNGTNDFRIKLQGRVLIHRDWSQLKKNTSESAPLMLSLKTYHICSFCVIVLLVRAPCFIPIWCIDNTYVFN